MISMKIDIEFYGSAVIGERGQVVIPKEAREALEFKQGESVLVFRAPFGNGLIVVKPDAFENQMLHMSKRIKEIMNDA